MRAQRIDKMAQVEGILAEVLNTEAGASGPRLAVSKENLEENLRKLYADIEKVKVR